MGKQSKDNIENFFRKGAQNYNFEFNESDWYKLKAKLDKELPVAFFPWLYIKRYWPIPLILIIALGSFLVYQRILNKISLSERHEMQSNSNTNNPELRATIDTQSTKNNKNMPSSYLPADNLNQTKSKNQKESSQVTGQAKDLALDNQNTKTVNEEDRKVTNDKYKFQHQSSEKNMGHDIKNKAEEVVSTTSTSLIITKKLSPVFTITPFASEKPLSIDNIQEPDRIVYEKQKPHKFLSLGIGLSPDFSTVRASDFVSPGVRWKFYLEYNFYKRFAISTGAIYVNNKYEAYGEDYHAPARYWKNGIVASEAYGECIMIDIPLNIRYNQLIIGKHQVFISGGFSTYFVLKEDYFFSYEIDDPDLPDYWGTDKMSSYPFGIVNASIGYEYLLNRKSSLQVEPFIKIPTTGIGWGEVKLYTVGIFFAYKFRPGKIKY